VPGGAAGGGGEGCGAVGGSERVTRWVATDVDDFGQETAGDYGTDAVDAGQRAAGVFDQDSDLPFEGGGFGVDGDDTFQPASGQVRAGAVVIGNQVERLADPGAGGEVADLVLVAGERPVRSACARLTRAVRSWRRSSR
jgi:hypothetical protein